MSAADRHGQGREKWTTDGGSQTAAIAAGVATAAHVVKPTEGRLCKVLVTAAGSAALAFYDNATEASGTVIGVIPDDAAVGDLFTFDAPAAKGIVAALLDGSPAVTVSFY